MHDIRRGTSLRKTRTRQGSSKAKPKKEDSETPEVAKDTTGEKYVGSGAKGELDSKEDIQGLGKETEVKQDTVEADGTDGEAR